MGAALGIDGCRSGWFWFRFNAGVGTFGVAGTLAELLADFPDGGCALIDIPIGLRARGKRERLCDIEARERLGPRRASVFAAPESAENIDFGFKAARDFAPEEKTIFRRRSLCRGIGRGDRFASGNNF